MRKILAVLAIVLLLPVYSGLVVQAQTLSKENPDLMVTGQTLNTTADDLDVDLTIHPNDNITDPSGQDTISTEGATDIDINAVPPKGISVIIQNETVTVTENPVSISGGDLAAEEAANPESIVPGPDTPSATDVPVPDDQG